MFNMKSSMDRVRKKKIPKSTTDPETCFCFDLDEKLHSPVHVGKVLFKFEFDLFAFNRVMGSLNRFFGTFYRYTVNRLTTLSLFLASDHKIASIVSYRDLLSVISLHEYCFFRDFRRKNK